MSFPVRSEGCLAPHQRALIENKCKKQDWGRGLRRAYRVWRPLKFQLNTCTSNKRERVQLALAFSKSQPPPIDSPRTFRRNALKRSASWAPLQPGKARIRAGFGFPSKIHSSQCPPKVLRGEPVASTSTKSSWTLKTVTTLRWIRMPSFWLQTCPSGDRSVSGERRRATEVPSDRVRTRANT